MGNMENPLSEKSAPDLERETPEKKTDRHIEGDNYVGSSEEKGEAEDTNRHRVEREITEAQASEYAAEASALAGNPGEEREDGGGGSEVNVDELIRVKEEVAELRIELDAKREQAQENYDKMLRDRAELENFRRRMQREKSDALRFASEPLLRDILPVIDNLERGIAHGRETDEGSPLIEGVELALRLFLDTLEKHGISRIFAEGEAFDPSCHEAVTQMESDESPPNTVLQELQAGYKLYDRLLRPVMVCVSKAPIAEE